MKSSALYLVRCLNKFAVIFAAGQFLRKAFCMQIRRPICFPCIAVIILGPLVCTPVPAAVTFFGDWTGFGTEFQQTTNETVYSNGKPIQWVAAWSPDTWRMVTEAATGRLTVVNDPSSPKQGNVLEVKVLPGDNPGSGERDEVFRMLDSKGADFPVTGASGHEFYGISVKLDPNWTPPLKDPNHWNAQWGIFLQLHSPNSFDSPPAIALSAINTFGIQILTGDLIDAMGNRRNAELVPFTNGSLNPGRWVEFLLDIVWAGDSKGSLTVYRRDQGETEFNQVFSRVGIPTLQSDSKELGSVDKHYWRCGYYRSVSPGVVSHLWLGPVVRGTARSDVAAAAFGGPIPRSPTALHILE